MANEILCFWFKDGRKVFRRGKSYFLLSKKVKQKITEKEVRILEKELQKELIK